MVEFPLSLLMALGVGAVSIAYNVISQRRTQKEINRLQAQLRDLQQVQPSELQQAQTNATQEGSQAVTHCFPTINTTALELHYKIFQRTPEYDELQDLKYLRDQFVSPRNRDRLMQAVENAYKEELATLRSISLDLTAEDNFLCMMSMMKFSTHDIAACLGVSDDAIRKRRSRVRQKLNVPNCILNTFHLIN